MVPSHDSPFFVQLRAGGGRKRAAGCSSCSASAVHATPDCRKSPKRRTGLASACGLPLRLSSLFLIVVVPISNAVFFLKN